MGSAAHFYLYLPEKIQRQPKNCDYLRPLGNKITVQNEGHVSSRIF
jgi:hypothetical protein